MNVDPYNIVMLLWCFVLGCCIGSFLNVVVYRMPLDKSLIYPASHCPKCMTPIPLRYNIPVFGWLILKGRCSSCSCRISVRYPLVELWTGLVVAGVWFYLITLGGDHPAPVSVVVLHAAALIILTAATLTDFDHMVIPRQLTLVGLGLGIVFSLAFPQVHQYTRQLTESAFQRQEFAYDSSVFVEGLRDYPRLDGLAVSVTGAVVGYGLLWIIRTLGGLAFRKEVMGLGDLDLMAFVGAVAGPRYVVAAYLFGVGIALVGTFVVVLVKRSTKGLKKPFPFGPSLALSSALVILFWDLGPARFIVFYEVQFRLLLGLD